MDETDLLKSSGLSVGVIGIIYVAIKLIKSINNKRIHSKCNGKDMIDVVIDVREATDEEKRSTPRASPALNAITVDKKISDLVI
jgi:hypothetical protein